MRGTDSGINKVEPKRSDASRFARIIANCSSLLRVDSILGWATQGQDWIGATRGRISDFLLALAGFGMD